MKYVFTLFLLFMTYNSIILFKFDKNSDVSSWYVVDDVVMGGKSNGKFYVSEEGKGVFTGVVSLENNGGFSSARYQFNQKEIKGYRKVLLRVKGDGKPYQFRIKKNVEDYYSYITSFNTSGEWETIEIKLNQMYPSFRGRKLALPNYQASVPEEVAFLIGNKQNEKFKLEIEQIIIQ